MKLLKTSTGWKAQIKNLEFTGTWEEVWKEVIKNVK